LLELLQGHGNRTEDLAMTIFVGLGMPGVMCSWGFAALHALAREALGDYEIMGVDTVEDMRTYVENRTKPHAVIISQFPEARLSEVILRVNLPALVFLEKPMDAVSYLARSTGQRDMSGVRAVSASLACLEPFTASPSALVMRRSHAGPDSDIDWLVERMAHHLGAHLTAAQMASVMQHIGMGPQLPAPPKLEAAAAALVSGYIPPQGDGADLEPFVREATEKVLFPLDHPPQSTLSGPSAVWPYYVFFSGERPGESFDEVIELTGAARCLLYGPYLHIPCGEWNATLSFDIERDSYGQVFTAEIHSTELLGALRFSPRGVGSFQATISVTITDPKPPVEIRLMMDSGAIEGRLSHWTIEWSRTL
jgi:hypothetical protein